METQTIRGTGYVPVILPDGWTDEKVRDVAGRKALHAAVAGSAWAVDQDAPVTEVHREPIVWPSDSNSTAEYFPAPPGQHPDAFRVTWEGTVIRNVSPEAVTAGMYEDPPGQWIADVERLPHPAIVGCRHGLDTETVIVSAFRRDPVSGQFEPCGYREAMPITRGEVEVVTIPGTARLTVVAAPEDAPDA